jgi:lysyl-tRNA synthetase class 2
MTEHDDRQNPRGRSLERMRELGVTPYALPRAPSHTTAQALALLEGGAHEGVAVSLAGRVMARRVMGRSAFVDLHDASGALQLHLRRDVLGERFYDEVFRGCVDLGDHLHVGGELFVTRSGEPCLRVDEATVLTKSLRPLPVVKSQGDRVFDDVSDVELRYRQRHVDLAIHPRVREVFVGRSRMISRMRRWLEDRGYLEVETPVLQPVYGGAHARPFTTWHNTLGQELYLRIADELYLKRLIVGGFEGVFEIAKNFRNEGVSRAHNPEFTMLELYVAHQDLEWMMRLVEGLLADLAVTLHGAPEVPDAADPDASIDLSGPFARERFFEAIAARSGLELRGAGHAELREAARGLGLPAEGSQGKLLDVIFSHVVEPTLLEPTFVTDYPTVLSPLARPQDDAPDLVDRFELFVRGRELGNAFQELADPAAQRARFEEQARARAEGDDEAPPIDEDYLRALEYGMPPTVGLGIGVDRLAMLMLGQASIRDVLLFPAMRPE